MLDQTRDAQAGWFHLTHQRLERWIREPFNGISHGLGALLAVVGLVLLIVASDGKPWHIVAFSIYGGSMILLYLASTLYHSLHGSDQKIEKLMAFDQVAIYMLIAGTYTPVCLVPLRGPWGWSILGVIWGIALTGIVLRVAWRTAPRWLPIALYLLMGWMALIAVQPLSMSLPLDGSYWLFVGGIVYTIGAVIFAAQRPRLWPGFFGSHELWHLFVLGGSACHFVMMYFFVVPLR